MPGERNGFVVRLESTFDQADVDGILKMIRDRSDTESRVLLDCSALTQVDSTKVAALCQLVNACSRIAPGTRLESIGPRLSRVLRVLDLHDLLVHGECTPAAAPTPHAPLTTLAGSRHLHLSFRPKHDSLDSARARFRTFVDSFSDSEVDSCELEIVFYEIATNILLHGGLRDTDAAVFEAACDGDRVRMVFTYPGEAFDPTVLPDDYNPSAYVQSGRSRGLGLTMVRRMTNQMSYRRDGGNLNVLILEKQLRVVERTMTAIENVKSAEIPVITAGVKLDSDNAHEMIAALQLASKSGRRFAIIDLAQVERVSSAGAGSILGFVSQFRQNSGDIVLCNVSSSVRHVFNVLDLTDYLTIKADVDRAREYCKTFGTTAGINAC